MNIDTLREFLHTQAHPSKYLGKYPYRFSTLISNNYPELSYNLKMFRVIYLEVNQEWDNLNPEVQVELLTYFTSLRNSFIYKLDILNTGRKGMSLNKDRFNILKELLTLHQKIHRLLVSKTTYSYQLKKANDF
jgi:hypothetical protein